MSWLRIEGKMPTHWKVAPLSDAAFRLHVTAMAWCAEHRTNGFVAKNIPETLTKSPKGKHLASTIHELATAKLWHVLEDCYEIHDFLDWNLSKEDYDKRAAAGAAGGRAKASKRLASAKHPLSVCSSKTLAVSDTDTEKIETHPKNGSPVGQTPIRDALGDSLVGRGHWQRSDVREVFDVWKSQVGLTGARCDSFRNPHSEHIARAIDSYGLESCLLVARSCMADDWVNGKLDDKGAKHITTAYIFGKLETFERILTAAKKSADQAAKPQLSYAEQIARQKAL